MDSLADAYNVVLVLTYLSLLINFHKFSFNSSVLYFIAFNVLFVTEIIAQIQYFKNEEYTFLTYQVGYDCFFGLIVLFFYYVNMKRKTLVLWSILIFSIANFADIALFFGQSESYKDLNMSLFQNYSVIYFINLLIYLIVIFAFIFESFSSEVILKLKYFFPFWITVSLLIDKIGKIPISFQMISVKDDIELFSFFNTFISILSLTTIIIGIFLNKKIPISNLNSAKNKIE